MAGERQSTNSDQRDQRELREITVAVNRVTKVVKGGRILGFSALVVVGNGEGKIGFGKGKAREVPAAVKKAAEEARRSMVTVKLSNATIYHAVYGRHGAAKVYLQPASRGTGRIAGGPMRAVLEVCGIENVLAKCIGSSNPHNLVRATINALQAVRSPAEIASRRGKPIAEIKRNHRLIV
ncbi:MAG: 30S ribosomal protein S5 [Betaproteobacteria bacterium]|nr:30S ribosomal protein S5 [Betaproteobacteria bacterium]